ncbi:hypothetical protein DFS33DRAFT_1434603, partial [Desarmillaria ectypa]
IQCRSSVVPETCLCLNKRPSFKSTHLYKPHEYVGNVHFTILSLPSMSSNPSVLKHDISSYIEDLPLEIFEEILSHLNISTIKQLSLASPNIHTACFPHFFRNLALHADYNPAHRFLADFKGRVPIPCLHTIELEWLDEDISTEILPWCTRVHSAKINRSHLGNTTILPALTILGFLELTNLTFPSLDDYFRLLESLPLTVKKIKIRKNTFRQSQSTWTVGRRVELDQLETDSAPDLAPFLRDNCPVSLLSIRVASVRQPYVEDVEDFVKRTPLLIDLCIEIDESQGRVSFTLTRLKSLSVITKTEDPAFLFVLFSTPSDGPSPLECLDLTFPYNWLGNITIAPPIQQFEHNRPENDGTIVSVS